jgi:glutamine amidotransferase
VKVAIINYGMGNLGSVRRALEDLAVQVLIAEHPAVLYEADRMILPGVGAFGEAMMRLRERGWEDVIRRLVIDEARPLLGICLGMQMLATSSEENGLTPGLDFISGRVRRLNDLGCDLRIPHVGWNEVRHGDGGATLFAGIPQGIDFYFVHSFALVADDAAHVAATTEYGVQMTAAVQRGSIFGTQFHPEKSSRAGRQILLNFVNYRPC